MKIQNSNSIKDAARKALDKWDALTDEQLKEIMLDPKYHGLYHHIQDMTSSDEDDDITTTGLRCKMQIPVWDDLMPTLEFGYTPVATGYFAQIKKYERLGYALVPICGGLPDWFHHSGYWCKRLAPKWEFFAKWKRGELSNDEYIECYYKQVLDTLNPKRVLKDIHEQTHGQKVVLLCYEKPFDFCHRHLVAHWLSTNTKKIVKELEIA